MFMFVFSSGANFFLIFESRGAELAGTGPIVLQIKFLLYVHKQIENTHQGLPQKFYLPSGSTISLREILSKKIVSKW